MRLTISRGLIDEMRARASSSPNAEICGLLLGQESRISEVRHCANIAVDSSDSFEIDPAALIAAHRSARTGGPVLLGHYHSHPRGAARPSRRDAEAAEAGTYWIILGEGDLNCWHTTRDQAGVIRFDPVELVSAD